jgi:hypothetical protein
VDVHGTRLAAPPFTIATALSLCRTLAMRARIEARSFTPWCQPPPNKLLERTVIRRRVRAACASFHCAHATRWTRGHAVAQLRR